MHLDKSLSFHLRLKFMSSQEFYHFSSFNMSIRKRGGGCLGQGTSKACCSAAADIRRLADSQLRHGPYPRFGGWQRDALLGVHGDGPARDVVGAGVVVCGPTASLVIHVN